MSKFEGASGQEGQEQGQPTEAPVYYPTEEEFEDVLGYIASIRPHAEKYGIAKIVPPGGKWQPCFALNLEELRFKTRVQRIDMLHRRTHSMQEIEEWWQEYRDFRKANGKKQAAKNPTLGKKTVDLFRLFRAVERRGGYAQVCKEKRWGEIAKAVQVHLANGNTTYSLRMVYEKYLGTYENHKLGKGLEDRIERQNAAAWLCDVAKAVKNREDYESGQDKNNDHNCSRRTSLSSFDDEVIDLLTDMQCQRREEEQEVKRQRSDEGPSSRIEPEVIPNPVAVTPIPGNLDVLMCEQCGGGQHEESIVLCDNCPHENTKGYHLFCCSPPIQEIPQGNWYCPECSNKLFGRNCFGAGPELTYPQFVHFAEQFEATYFGSKQAALKITGDELEREFWKIVEEKEDAVEVLYGADLETGSSGSGFSPNGPMSSHPWNLNNLPRQPSSLLRLIPEQIPGVQVPWMYVGMRFSAFCWHVEDHLFYSANYLHMGSGKKWYGIPSSGADAFESVLRNDLSKEQFEKQPDLLFHLTMMVSPEKLRARGVKVYETVQEEGEFVITFPRSYHGGFNMGVNIAEAVNFAPPDWLRFANLAQERYALHRKVPVLSTEELMIDAAKDPGGHVCGPIFKEEFSRVIEREAAARLRLWNIGVLKSRRVPFKIGLKETDEEDVTCSICRQYLHLTAVSCPCSNRHVCPGCINHQCECPHLSKTLVYRYSLADLVKILDTIEDVKPKADGNAMNGDVKEDLPPPVTSNGFHNDDVMDVNGGGDCLKWSLTLRTTYQGTQQGVKRDRNDSAKDADGSDRFQSFLAAWKQRAERVVHYGGSRTSEIANLIGEAEQFLWAGSELDAHRELYAKLEEARTWIADIKKAHSGKVHPEKLEQLLTLNPAPVNLPGINKLRTLHKEVAEWLVSARDILQSKQPVDVSVLDEIVEKGSQLNVELSDLTILQGRLNVAMEVRNCLRAFFCREPGGKSLEASDLKRLQQKALQARVSLPELEKLQGTLKGIENWQERARRCLGMRAALCELQELLSEVHDMPAYVPEVNALKNLVKQVENWRSKADEFLARNVSLKKLRELLHVGERLSVELPEVEEFRRALRKREWDSGAKRGTSGKQVTISALQDLIAEGQLCGAQDLPTFQALKDRLDAAKAWIAEATAVLENAKGARESPGDEKVSLAQLELLAKQGVDTSIKLEEMKELTVLLNKCREIHSKIAGTFDNIDQGIPFQSDIVLPILESATSMNVHFDRLDELSAKVEAAKVFSEDVLSGMGEVGIDQLDQLHKALLQVSEFAALHGFQTLEMHELWRTDGRLRAEWLSQCLLADDLSFQGYPQRSSDLPLNVWEKSPLFELKDKFSDAVQRQLAGQRVPLSDRPSLGDVKRLLVLGIEVGCNKHLFEKLEVVYMAASTWEDRVGQVLRGDRKVQSSELNGWLQEGLGCPFQLAGLDKLQGIVDKYRKWDTATQEVIRSMETSRVPVEEVRKLASIMENVPVESSPSHAQLKDILQKVQNFNISLRHGISLPLQQLFSSIQRVLSAISTQDGQGHEGGCYCGNAKSSGPALSCIECKEWMHIECLPAYAKASRKWVCQLCSGSCEVERPTNAKLRALLEAARQLKVVVPEEQQLDAIVSHYRQWHAHVSGLLDGHDASQVVGGDPAGALPKVVMKSILKQTAMIGVDASALQERVDDLLKAEKWRGAVKDMLLIGERTKHQIPKCRGEEVPIRRNLLKPRIEAVQDVIKQAGMLRIDWPRDAMLVAAQNAISAAQQWAAEGRVLESLLDAHAGEPIERVPSDLLHRTASHIRKAGTCAVRVDDEILEYLVYQSTPYCLCKQTNEVERPMLACEEEEKCPILWFHYECVGLHEDRPAPPGYKCPHCCAREGKPYPFELPQKFAVELANKYGAETLFGVEDDDVEMEEGEGKLLEASSSRAGGGGSNVGSTLSHSELDMGQYLADLAVQWSALKREEKVVALGRLEGRMKEENNRLQADKMVKKGTLFR